MSTETPVKPASISPTYDFTELDAKLWKLFSENPSLPVSETKMKAIDPLRVPDRLGTYIGVGWVEPGKDVFGNVEDGTWGVTGLGQRFLSGQAQKWDAQNPPATQKSPSQSQTQTPGQASKGGPR